MFDRLRNHGGILIAVGVACVAAATAGVPFSWPLTGCGLVAVGAMAMLAGRAMGSPVVLALQAVVYSAAWLLMAAAILAKGQAPTPWLMADLVASAAVMAIQAPLLWQAAQTASHERERRA